MAKGAAAQDDGLDELRAELAEFVLREAGTRIAERPDLPLSGALVAAISAEVGRAVEAQRQTLPSAADLAEGVLRELRPELGAIRAARGEDGLSSGYYGERAEAAATSSAGTKPVLILVAVAVVALLLGGLGGYALAGGFSKPEPVITTPPDAEIPPLNTPVDAAPVQTPPGGTGSSIIRDPERENVAKSRQTGAAGGGAAPTNRATPARSAAASQPAPTPAPSPPVSGQTPVNDGTAG